MDGRLRTLVASDMVMIDAAPSDAEVATVAPSSMLELFLGNRYLKAFLNRLLRRLLWEEEDEESSSSSSSS